MRATSMRRVVRVVARRGVTILRSRAELAEWRGAREGSSIGLVPTMGALHAGHEDLMRRAVAENDVTIASIFVNPTQFAPGEDLDRYPRTFDGDVAVLRSAGVGACFAPAVEEMYGAGAGGVVVHPPARFDALSEGAARPGHFAGVCTVVSKLWNCVRPTRSYFGQKDAMQCAVLRSLQRDLIFDVDVVVCPTARAEDGLALSSRNAYLEAGERAAAPVVYAALRAARDAWLAQTGPAPAAALRDAARARLRAEPLVRDVEYVSVADYDTMAELDDVDAPDRRAPDTPTAILSVAVRLGNVRLIDNLPLRASSL